MPCKDITIEEAKIRFLKSWARLNIPENALGKKIKQDDEEFVVLGLGYRIRDNGLVVKEVKTGEIRRLPITLVQNKIL
jgi:hypothetical protein